MANLQYGDRISFPTIPSQINKIVDVAPIRFDTLEESWVVCAQNNATHMLIVMDISIEEVDIQATKYMLVEIGKCENLYLLADAIVD